MKRAISLVTAFVVLALGTNVLAASFTAGNIVVYRVGPDSGLTNTGNTVWLDEFNTSGTLVQSIMMPTNFNNGANSPLIASGLSSLDGLLTLSADGRFIVLTGYGARLGGSGDLPNTPATSVPRVVGTVDGSGRADTTTVQTNSSNNAANIRSAVSTDGTNLWYAGSAQGINYATRGSSTGTQLSSFITNIRQLNIFSNQLYFSTASGGSVRIGTATNSAATPPPTTTNNVFYGSLSGLSSNAGTPNAFVLFNFPAGTNTLNTLYFGDDSAARIYKFSLVSGNWVTNGFLTIGSPNQPRGLTGKIVGGTNVVLYITRGPTCTIPPCDTSGTYLIGYTDWTGFNAAPTGSGGALEDVFDFATSVGGVAGQTLRGVAFVPTGTEPYPAGAGRITVGPITAFNYFGLTGGPFGTKDYSILNPGTNTVTWTATVDTAWVSLTPSNGTLATGATNTITVSFGAAANSFLGGTTNTATMTISNTTVAPDDQGTTTRPITLVVDEQRISPTTDFTSSGAPGGPFSPSNKVYTVTNGVNAFTLTVSKTTNWFDLSATSVSVSGNTSTNITVSINTNANALAAGNYSGVISFSNSTLTTLIDTRNVNLAAGTIYFCDDFSTYIQSTDLNGQQGWKRHTTSASVGTLPIQVTGGQVVLPAGQTVDNEDVYKDTVLSSNEVAVFLGMTITVTNVPTGGTSYMLAIIGKNGGTVTSGSFANYRIGATNDGGGFFAFSARTTGQAGDPPTSGASTLSTGTTYRLIVMTDTNGTNVVVYVNPTSAVLSNNTAYLTHVMGATATAATGAGGVLLSQFSNGSTIANVGYSLGKLCINTNYADVYNSITTAPPPLTLYETWQTNYFGSTNAVNAAANADPDGDGMSNTNEFLAGFNPTNNAAYLRVISVAKTGAGTNVTVTYLGANGDTSYPGGPSSRTNVLEFTAGAAGSYSNSFATAGVTNILSGGTGSGVTTNMVDAGGGTNSPSRYYRVRVLAP